MRQAVSSLLVDDIEQQLRQSLTRVQPDQEFVDHLHSRLKNPSQLSIEQRLSLGRGLLLVAGSLVSGILLLFLLRQLRLSSN